jgi:hypothetical protein
MSGGIRVDMCSVIMQGYSKWAHRSFVALVAFWTVMSWSLADGQQGLKSNYLHLQGQTLTSFVAAFYGSSKGITLIILR